MVRVHHSIFLSNGTSIGHPSDVFSIVLIADFTHSPRHVSFNLDRKTHRSTTQAEQEEIRHSFRLLDSEGKGRVSVQDVRDALQDGSERAAVLLQELAPLDDEDTLTLTEFTSFVTKRHDDGDADDMTRMFRLFDKDKKGYIELKDLKRIAAELGENMTDAELREMVDRGSNQTHGKVTLEEFTTIMNKKLWA